MYKLENVYLNTFYLFHTMPLFLLKKYRLSADCSILFQIIKLINISNIDPNGQIPKKVKLKTHSYIGFAFNVTQVKSVQHNMLIKVLLCMWTFLVDNLIDPKFGV